MLCNKCAYGVLIACCARDLKPSNILLSGVGDDRVETQVKIGDLGLARSAPMKRSPRSYMQAGGKESGDECEGMDSPGTAVTKAGRQNRRRSKSVEVTSWTDEMRVEALKGLMSDEALSPSGSGNSAAGTASPSALSPRSQESSPLSACSVDSDTYGSENGERVEGTVLAVCGAGEASTTDHNQQNRTPTTSAHTTTNQQTTNNKQTNKQQTTNNKQTNNKQTTNNKQQTNKQQTTNQQTTNICVFKQTIYALAKKMDIDKWTNALISPRLFYTGTKEPPRGLSRALTTVNLHGGKTAQAIPQSPSQIKRSSSEGAKTAADWKKTATANILASKTQDKTAIKSIKSIKENEAETSLFGLSARTLFGIGADTGTAAARVPLESGDGADAVPGTSAKATNAKRVRERMREGKRLLESKLQAGSITQHEFEVLLQRMHEAIALDEDAAGGGEQEEGGEGGTLNMSGSLLNLQTLIRRNTIDDFGDDGSGSASWSDESEYEYDEQADDDELGNGDWQMSGKWRNRVKKAKGRKPKKEGSRKRRDKKKEKTKKWTDASEGGSSHGGTQGVGTYFYLSPEAERGTSYDGKRYGWCPR
jgi:hypothetical protein